MILALLKRALAGATGGCAGGDRLNQCTLMVTSEPGARGERFTFMPNENGSNATKVTEARCARSAIQITPDILKSYRSSFRECVS
jgi:hypothetical protein